MDIEYLSYTVLYYIIILYIMCIILSVQSDVWNYMICKKVIIKSTLTCNGSRGQGRLD